MSRFLKIVLSFCALGAILWLGGNIMKSIIAYDIFEPVRELPLKSDKPYDAVFQTVYLYSSMAFYTTIGYFATFISLVIITVKMKSSLKLYGWLFMAVSLFFLSSPIEFVRMYYDLQIQMAVHIEGIRDTFHPVIEQYFIERYRSGWFTGLATMSVFANVSALLLIIWKPLDRSRIQSNNL